MGSQPLSERTAGGRVILILGPHRAGTSATTRILNMLGVDLGRDDQLEGVAGGNAKGLFENRRIMRINEAVLRLFGGAWLDPPALEPGWEHDSALDDLREEAAEVLEANFGGRPMWGFKDPRTSLTLPFWRPLLGEPDYVICHRNALESARSLERRDGLSLRQGVALWARHMVGAILGTAGAHRILIDYDEYFSRRARVIADLAAFVGVPDAASDGHLNAEVDDWLDSELRHHRTELAATLDGPSVPPDVRPLVALVDLAVQIRGQSTDRRTAGEEPVDGALEAAALAFERARLSAAARRRLGAGTSPRRPSAGRADAVLAQRLPERVAGGASAFDFAVLATPFAGSALLYDLLSAHPDVSLCWERDSSLMDAGEHFAPPAAAFENGVRDGVLRGLVCPHGLSGTPELASEELAARLAATSPALKLITLVRDPIERALDHHRASVARGLEHRSAERALSEQLASDALLAARQRWSDTESYVAWSEHGRMVEPFRRAMPHAELLVLRAEELERDPSPALGRLFRFLGIDDLWRPQQTAATAGATDARPLATAEQGARLIEELRRVVFPLAGTRAEQAQRAFAPVFDRWNSGANREYPALPERLDGALRAHFAIDAGRLELAARARTRAPRGHTARTEHPGVIACVVDADRRFHLDALRWYAALTAVGGVDAGDLVVHAIGGTSSEALDWLAEQGVSVREVAPFDGGTPHCHKIAGALSLAAEGVEGVAVLTDTDVAICEDPRSLAVLPTSVALKVVDGDNPPLALLEAVFDAASVERPPVVPLELLADHATLATNGNGGLYAIPGDLLPHVAAAWAHWARWLLDRAGTQPAAVMRHADQVSMALALAAEGVEPVHLGLRWNLPLHLPKPLPPDTGAPAVLHYHGRVDRSGIISPYGRPSIDERIGLVNAAIARVFERARPHLESSPVGPIADV